MLSATIVAMNMTIRQISCNRFDKLSQLDIAAHVGLPSFAYIVLKLELGVDYSLGFRRSTSGSLSRRFLTT